MKPEEIWSQEEALWLQGEAAYRKALAENCLMVFPGVGPLDTAGVMEAIKQAPRWSQVHFERQTTSEIDGEAVVLAYFAEGRREGEAPYRAYCTSTYRIRDGHCKLIQHQQTPAE